MWSCVLYYRTSSFHHCLLGRQYEKTLYKNTDNDKDYYGHNHFHLSTPPPSSSSGKSPAHPFSQKSSQNPGTEPSSPTVSPSVPGLSQAFPHKPYPQTLSPESSVSSSAPHTWQIPSPASPALTSP